nr:putative ribonuclease H-like domain-containing protein [Tanacetum cinerariifolium]
MAFTSLSSSSSDSEVSSCSKACLKSYETLKEHYNNLEKYFNKSQLNLGAYKAGLESAEARLDVYRKNEAVFEENVKVLKLDVMLRDNALTKLRKKFKKAEKERDDLKLTLEKFENSFKYLSKLLDSQVSDSEDEDGIQSKHKQRKPSVTKVEFVKLKEQVKFTRKSVKQEEQNKQAKYPRKNSQSPRVVSNTKGNKANVVKASSCWVWRPKQKVLDHMSRHNGLSMNFKRFDYVDAQGRSKCDDGSEFKNKEMNQFCEIKGIRREFSVARTLQQNGVAERKYKTLIKAARTMLVDFKLPTTFWAEAVNTACYVQNRVLVIKPHNMTPYELFLGTKANIDAGQAGKKTVPGPQYVLLPLLTFDSQGLKSSEDEVADDVGKKREDANTNSTNRLNTVSSSVNAVSSSFTIVDPGRERAQMNEFESMIGHNKDANGNSTYRMFTLVSAAGSSYVNLCGSILVNAATLHSVDLPIDPLMPYLEDATDLQDTGIFSGAYDDEVEGVMADFNNLKLITVVSAPVAKIEAIRGGVYVCQPPGFKDPHFPDKVYKVEKALYGLHQAPRACQDKYVADILKKFDFYLVKIANTPIETNKALLKDKEAADVDVHLYRSMIGSLMYLTASKSDIMFAVCACARFQVTPKVSHLHAVKGIFRYLKGGCRFLRKRLILWQCKKQTVVANSTTEAEYVDAANCCGHVLWIQNQMLDYGFNFMNTKIYIDNESIICIVKNPLYHSKTKHIEIRHHFIRDSYEKKIIQVVKIHTDHNVADLLTKTFDNEIAANDEIQVSVVGLTYYWHNENFVISSHTKKVFTNMKREGKDFSRKKKQKSKRKLRKEIKVPSPSSEIPNEENVPTISNDPLPSGEDRMKLNELMILSTNLQRQRMIEEDKFGVNDLDGDEVVVDVSASKKVEQSVKVVEKKVSTADPVTTVGEVVTIAGIEVTTSATTLQISKDELTPAQTLIEIKAAKPKAITTTVTIVTAVGTRPKEKGIVMQEPSKTPSPKPIISSQKPSQAKDKCKGKCKKVAEGSEKAEEDSSKRAAGKLEQEDAKRHRLEEENESAKRKRCLEIIHDDDDDDVTIEATLISSKSPTIVDYKIYKEGRKSFFKIIRVDVSVAGIQGYYCLQQQLMLPVQELQLLIELQLLDG